MKTDLKIYFLHYVINFIDNQFKICYSLEETFCSESIAGKNSDPFCKLQGNCYQVIFSKDYCFMKSLKNVNEEKPWMKQYIQNFSEEIFNCDESVNTFITEKNIEEKKHKIFYIREIDLKMKHQLFEKIVNNASFFHKIYTAEDIFFMCYSYAFSVLDNYIMILTNILYLISRQQFDLEQINREFIQYTTETNKDSENLIEFQIKFKNKNEYDLVIALDEFVEKHYDNRTRDALVSDVHHWNLSLINFFVTIQQTLCFSIITSKHESITEIHHNENPKSTFDIPLKYFENILLLLSLECKFHVRSLKDETKELFSLLYEKRPDILIRLDLTILYKKFYGYSEAQLIEENEIWNDFFSFLFNKTNKSIEIHICTCKIILTRIKQNKIEIYRKIIVESSNIDESLLISKKILMSNTTQIGNPLKLIAEMIYSDFMKREYKTIQDNSIVATNRRLLFSSLGNSYISEFHLNKMTDNGVNDLETQLNISMMSFCGNELKKPEIIGIFGLHQKFEYFDSMSGIFDDEISFFEFNTNVGDEPTKHKSNLVSEMVKFLYSRMSKTEPKNQNSGFDSESYDIKYDYEQYLTFSIYSNNSNYWNQYALATHYMSCNNSKIYCFNNKNKFHPPFESVYEMKAEMKIQIHHYIPKSRTETDFELYNCCKSIENLTFRSNALFYNFEIYNSNFHLLISRFMELRSIHKSLSSVVRRMESPTICYIHCICSYIKFISNNYHLFNDIHIKDCIIESELHIDFDLYNQIQHYIMISNTCYFFHISILSFCKLDAVDSENLFVFTSQNSTQMLEIAKFKVNFLEPIPEYFTTLKLTECFIEVKNNILAIDHKFLRHKQIEEIHLSEFYGDVITQLMDDNIVSIAIKDSVLSENMRFLGIFASIEMEKCVSSFSIDSYSQLIKIENHTGEFSIERILDRAVPLKEINLFDKDKFFVKIENLKMKNLQNIKSKTIHIINCEIDRISNLRCKELYISNTKCTFQLQHSTETINYFEDLVNLEKNETEYMLLKEYQH